MKLVSKIVIALATILVGGFIYFITNFGPIISGFGAKAVCSCVNVGHRNVQSVIDNELGAFPLSLGKFELSDDGKSATGTVFGLAEATAIYRKGLGCTLVREKTASEMVSNLPHVAMKQPLLSDTAYWPLGTKMMDTLVPGIEMESLQNAIDASFLNTHAELPAKTRAVVVIYKGQLIAEQYSEEFTKNSAQLGWSMTKSITNTMFGILTQQNRINIFDRAPVEEWSSKEDPRHEITTDALLRMSSGLHWEEVYSNVSTATNMLYKYADMGAFAASQPKEYEMNEKYYYSSGTTNILSRIIRQELGDESYYTFAQRELFSKIGVTSAVIEPDASGTFVGSSYMWATARDWARLGELYRNNGNWFGNQILPENWVTYSSTPTNNTPQGEYGAQFWLNAGEKGNPSNRLLPNVPTDMYMMDGYEGQRVFIVPSKDLVVVRLGQNKRGGFDYDLFLSNVIASIKNDQ